MIRQFGYLLWVVFIITLSAGCDDNKKQLILYAPLLSTSTYLIDENNQPIYEWTSDALPAQVAYLDEEGFLVRTLSDDEAYDDGNFFSNVGGGALGGIIERSYIDKTTGETITDWRFRLADDIEGADINNMVLHHDIALLPSGNILALLWQRKTYDESVQAGRNPESLDSDLGMFAEQIIELQRTENEDGSDSWEIVWQWDMWDHFVQTDYADKDNYIEGELFDYPNLIDINYNLETDTSIDVFHVNAVFYLEKYDQIVITSHLNSELWVIDHSTSTAEAATSSGGNYHRGGELLYRWGNAQAYGYPDDRYTFLSGVHDPSFVYNSLSDNKLGTFFMYDNNRDSGENSQVVEMSPPMTLNGEYLIGADVEGIYGPITTMLQADLGFQQDRLGTVKRLSTDLIFTCNCAGTGEAMWLDEQGKVMATMALSDNTIGSSVTPEAYRMQHYWSTDNNIEKIKK